MALPQGGGTGRGRVRGTPSGGRIREVRMSGEEPRAQYRDGDEAVGVKIVKEAVEEPIRCIAINAGAEGSVVVDAVKKSPRGSGFDASTMEYGDMVQKGVIDPLKVVRTALENAASVAVMILTTEALVTDIPEKAGAAPPMPDMGGMGGGMGF